MRAAQEAWTHEAERRTHSNKQRDKLLAIVRRCGFINPIIVGENDNVAGHSILSVWETGVPRRNAMAKKRKMARGTAQKGGNPPKHTQFRKGTSGNPRGRPKGSKNLSTYLMEAARDQVTATVGGRTRTISKLQATTMQLATKAAGGDQAAMGRFLDWVDEIETRAASVKPSQFPIGAPDIEVIRAVYERMKQCDPEKKREA
jgi:Family of unknown function (DUF5681)